MLFLRLVFLRCVFSSWSEILWKFACSHDSWIITWVCSSKCLWNWKKIFSYRSFEIPWKFALFLLRLNGNLFVVINTFGTEREYLLLQKFQNTANGDNTPVGDGEITTTEVACQFIPSVLRDAPSGVESSYNYSSLRTYGTQPEENGHASNGSPFRSSEGSPRPRHSPGHSELYQDYSQPKVRCKINF